MTRILFLLVPVSVLFIYCHSNAANKKPKALVASHGEYLFVLTDLWTSWMVALIWVGWARSQSAGRELRWCRTDSPGCTQLCSVTSHPAVLFSLRTQESRETEKPYKKTWAWHQLTVFSATAYCLRQVVRPAQVQEMGTRTPLVDGNLTVRGVDTRMDEKKSRTFNSQSPTH